MEKEIENIIDQLMASVAILFVGDDKGKIASLKDWSQAKIDANFSNREKAIKLLLSLMPKPSTANREAVSRLQGKIHAVLHNYRRCQILKWGRNEQDDGALDITLEEIMNDISKSLIEPKVLSDEEICRTIGCGMIEFRDTTWASWCKEGKCRSFELAKAISQATVGE